MKPETRLEIATRLVAEAEGLVMRQRELVASLEQDGRDAAQSLQLLQRFELTRDNFRRILSSLQSALP